MVKNWDTETADKCRLPKLIPGICEECRDKRYCEAKKKPTQISLFAEDKYDCDKCLFKKDDKCYPRDVIGRQRFIYQEEGTYCSDYCTEYPSRWKGRQL